MSQGGRIANDVGMWLLAFMACLLFFGGILIAISSHGIGVQACIGGAISGFGFVLFCIWLALEKS